MAKDRSVHGLILIFSIAAGLGLTLRYPFAGVLLWTWFALQQPHQEAYGFVQTAPLNLIIAAVTLAAWLVSRERKMPPAGFIFWLLVAFLVWMTFNSFFAFDPAWSWPYWDRTWKIFAMGLLVAATASTRIRMYALVWIAVISLFYYGVKGGGFTIITGGHYHVWGPASSIIGDNNQLALALLMTLPLANYLRNQVNDKRIAWLLLAALMLTIIAIVGSYSRGALIGLGTLGLFMLLRARNRFIYLAAASLMIVFVVKLMPEQFLGRMETIYTPTQDVSFEGRLNAWRVALHFASDNFPFGAGFYGPQLPAIFHYYFPDQTPHAAHSIYFQVLGEHGFIGLAIYLAILAAAFFRCSKIISVTRSVPDQQWAHDLAIAIQASLVVFCVGGAALSMAYYDLFIMEVAMLLPLQEIVLLKGRQKRAAWAAPNAAVPQKG